jgi:hypothetical protein
VALVGEPDGLRIISPTSCDFVQKVPGGLVPDDVCSVVLIRRSAEPTLAVFAPGSTHPAAILFEALEQFDRKSPKADDSIRSIRPDLGNAVDTCIDAAGRESEVHWQRKLLKVSEILLRISAEILLGCTIW